MGCPGHCQLRASPLPRDDRNHGTIVAILSSLTVATSQKSQTKVAICGLVFYGNIILCNISEYLSSLGFGIEMMQEYLTYNQIIKDQAVSSDTTTPWISRNAEALCPLASLHLVGAATFPVSF